jgi:hypothetical protein
MIPKPDVCSEVAVQISSDQAALRGRYTIGRDRPGWLAALTCDSQ